MNYSSTNFVSRSGLVLGIAIIGLCFTIVPDVFGGDPKDQTSDEEKAKETDSSPNSERLELMRRRVSKLNAEVETPQGSVKAELIPAPLLRFNNLASKIIVDDATVWAWGQVGRPMILATADPNGVEVVSLSEHPVSLSGRSGLKWKAAASEIKWKLVPNAPQPAPNAVARARQMKEICARFSAVGRYGDGTDLELRLLVRNLHRYANPDEKLSDGAIFALAGGTNPEVILLLECRETDKNQSAWYYGLTRQSGGNLEARLDDKIVWECPAIKGWDNRAPYMSNFKFDPDI